MLVKAYGDVKDNSDSGQFLAIQHASAYAFDHPEITASIAMKYSRRMDLLVEALKAVRFQARKPRGSFFLYVAAPKRGRGCLRQRRIGRLRQCGGFQPVDDH